MRDNEEDRADERAVTSEPVEKEDGTTVVIEQQNVGPGNQVGGGEFKNPDRGKSPEQAEADQDRLEEEAPIDSARPERTQRR
jgi:hypothetical protein